MKKVFLILIMVCGMARAQQTNVYFDFDSAELSGQTKAVLDSVMAQAKYYSGLPAAIQGFTDDKGTSGYNDTLALKRAYAVEAYLKQVNPTLKTKVMSERIKTWPEGTTDAQKRRVTLFISEMALCGYRPEYVRSTVTDDGVKVFSANFSGKVLPPVVTSGFTPGQMLANRLYGIDVEGNILKTFGMLGIQGGSDDGFYTVMIPIKDKTDPDMTVWLGQPGKDGTRWKDSDVKISTDPTGRYYVMRVPVGAYKECWVNLDKRTNRTSGRPWAIEYKEIYVATDKNYRFNNVNIGGPRSKIGFSARLNDTLFVFTVNKKAKTQNLNFNGYLPGQKKPLNFKLVRCTYTQDELGNDYYAMNKTTLQKKKTGFWAWLGRLFS